MKKNCKFVLLVITALFFGNYLMAGSIEWYGRKSGLFRPCRGESIRLCKRITTVDEYPIVPTYPLNPVNPGLTPIDPDKPIIDIMPMSMNEESQSEDVIVEYDGVEYQIPRSWINFEDGSITPQ